MRPPRVTYNLRFPGQYYDVETGKHYNYFRDYDASIGRYLESDPVGLGGGLNSFLYVGAASLRYSDRLGLSPDCDSEDCCKKANSNGLLNGLGGTVVCCNGKKFACAGPHRFGAGGPIARDCAKAHEDEHLPQVFCFGGAGPRFADTISDQRDVECPAYKVELKCLRKGLAGCGMDTACIQYVKDTIDLKITKGWGKFKCGLMP